MKELKTPAPQMWGLNENTKEKRRATIVPVPTPRATVLTSCISCGTPLQTEHCKTLCLSCYSYYHVYLHNNAALRLLREADDVS